MMMRYKLANKRHDDDNKDPKHIEKDLQMSAPYPASLQVQSGPFSQPPKRVSLCLSTAASSANANASVASAPNNRDLESPLPTLFKEPPKTPIKQKALSKKLYQPLPFSLLPTTHSSSASSLSPTAVLPSGKQLFFAPIVTNGNDNDNDNDNENDDDYDDEVHDNNNVHQDDDIDTRTLDAFAAIRRLDFDVPRETWILPKYSNNDKTRVVERATIEGNNKIEIENGSNSNHDIDSESESESESNCEYQGNDVSFRNRSFQSKLSLANATTRAINTNTIPLVSPRLTPDSWDGPSFAEMTEHVQSAANNSSTSTSTNVSASASVKATMGTHISSVSVPQSQHGTTMIFSSSLSSFLTRGEEEQAAASMLLAFKNVVVVDRKDDDDGNDNDNNKDEGKDTGEDYVREHEDHPLFVTPSDNNNNNNNSMSKRRKLSRTAKAFCHDLTKELLALEKYDDDVDGDNADDADADEDKTIIMSDSDIDMDDDLWMVLHPSKMERKRRKSRRKSNLGKMMNQQMKISTTTKRCRHPRREQCKKSSPSSTARRSMMTMTTSFSHGGGGRNNSIHNKPNRLSTPEDSNELNSLHCFVRSELLEVFALDDDATCNNSNSNNKNNKHQGKVGLRCVFCGHLPRRHRTQSMTSTSTSTSTSTTPTPTPASMAIFYPKSIQDIYRSVCTWQRIHFKACPHVPQEFIEQYDYYKDTDRTRGKKYHWATAAYRLGLRNVDEHRGGIVWKKSNEEDDDDDHFESSDKSSDSKGGNSGGGNHVDELEIAEC